MCDRRAVGMSQAEGEKPDMLIRRHGDAAVSTMRYVLTLQRTLLSSRNFFPRKVKRYVSPPLPLPTSLVKDTPSRNLSKSGKISSRGEEPNENAEKFRIGTAYNPRSTGPQIHCPPLYSLYGLSKIKKVIEFARLHMRDTFPRQIHKRKTCAYQQ